MKNFDSGQLEFSLLIKFPNTADDANPRDVGFDSCGMFPETNRATKTDRSGLSSPNNLQLKKPSVAAGAHSRLPT
jgi:hypothetical protein